MKKHAFLLGLTGSIAMGKTTTTDLFADQGVPVWRADSVVHRLYAKDGAGVKLIGDLVPQAVTDGAVDRVILRQKITKTPLLLGKIESVIHPLVTADRIDFINKTGSDLVVFDIPLLYETGAEAWLDAVLVVTASAATQKKRVMARAGMSTETLALVMARQMPDFEKRARAYYIIDTSVGIDDARAQVQALIQQIRRENSHA